MIADQKPPVQLTRSVPPWWVFGGSLAVVLVILAAIGPNLWPDTEAPLTATGLPPTASSPPVPKIDYQDLISEETGKAKEQTELIVKAHEASLVKLDAMHQPKFSTAAYSASEHAARYIAIAKLIGYLAWDKVKGTSEADTYLNTLIDPSISPALADFHKDVNAETARFEYELRKVTVQLATNIAAIGPGNAPPPPRLDTQEDTSRDFQEILKSLGKGATLQVVGGIAGPTMYDLLGKSILPKLIKPISAIAGRMFAKQIAKVAAIPVIASASGPVPVGPILAVIGAVWTGYDVYHLRSEFRDTVYGQLRADLDEVRTSSISQVSKSASVKSEEIQKLQLDMGVRALDDFTKQDAK